MRRSRHNNYEEIYLLESRMQSCISKESEEFLKREETQKVLNHIVSLSYRKNKPGLMYLGIECDDIRNTAMCLCITFYGKYSQNFKTETSMYYGLMRFLGQKIDNYIKISQKKLRPVMEYNIATDLEKTDLLRFLCGHTEMSAIEERSGKQLSCKNVTKIHNLAYKQETRQKELSELLEHKIQTANPRLLQKIYHMLRNNRDNEETDLMRELCIKKIFDITSENFNVKKDGSVVFSKRDTNKISSVASHSTNDYIQKIAHLLQHGVNSNKV